MNDWLLYQVAKQRVEEDHRNADLFRQAYSHRESGPGFQAASLNWLGGRMIHLGQSLQRRANHQTLCYEIERT